VSSNVPSVPAGAARRNHLQPERRAAVKGALLLGAAKRTLDGEHRSGIQQIVDGRIWWEHVPAGEL
jgi:hypothetical protein